MESIEEFERQTYTQPRQINADEKDLPTLVENIWQAIQEANAKNPSIFRFSGGLVRLEKDEQGQPKICRLDEKSLRLEVSKRAKFVVTVKTRQGLLDMPALPPKHGIEGVLSTPDKPAPILKKIIRTPVFAPDGSLITDAGYHAQSQIYLWPISDLTVPSISKIPSDEESAEAKRLIFDELLFDFPFERESDKAHALAMLLLPGVRELIHGRTPLHCVDAPTQGTGKGLLVDVCAGLWFGDHIPRMTEGREEDEWRKRIFSTLMKAPNAVLLDNIKKRIESGALEAALTSDKYEDRVLGASENKAVPTSCVWIATGNNLSFGSEMVRRILRIRMDAKIDRPFFREKFRHADLRGWAKENQGRLIWAALTICQSWIAAGRPPAKIKKLGSFENWSEIIGAILEHNKIPGFLNDLDYLYEESDVEFQTHRNFVSAWHEKFGTREVGTSDLFDLAVSAGIHLGSGSERSAKTRLGIVLSKMRNRIFEEKTVCKGVIASGIQQWYLDFKSDPSRERCPF